MDLIPRRISPDRRLRHCVVRPHLRLGLYTLARGKPIKRGYAMTGELNLSGHVMPIGGIREKVIAARRAKVRHIVVPKDNEGEFDRLPEYLKKKITPHFVETFDEVIALCLR